MLTPCTSTQRRVYADYEKGDATGEKKHRPNIREISKGRFRKLDTVEHLWEALFGIA